MVSSNPDGYRVKCDSCGARYFYSVDKLDEYGSVECQNCAGRIFVDSLQGHSGVPFRNDESIRPSKVSGQSVAGIKIKCPHCLAGYIYKEYQMLEDGKVACQNCGKNIDAIGEDEVGRRWPREVANTEFSCTGSREGTLSGIV